MNYNTMKATIDGITGEGVHFSEELVFTLVPPKKTRGYYGNGYYMSVKMPAQTLWIDVRYERTTDIEILADRWIKKYYGKNAQNVTKQF